MEKFIKLLKTKIKAKTSVIAVFITVIITSLANIGVLGYMQYTNSQELSSNVDIKEEEVENEIESEISEEDILSLEDLTSQEELQQISEEKDDEETQSSQESSPKYYIKVNYGAQVVNIYTKDSNGNYTVPVKAMICSTGTATPTSGVYTVGYKWQWLKLIGNVWGHYVTQIYGDILFHSVPYLTKGDLSSLEYWEYDKLGTKASLGCVRLTAEDALWIYNNISSGTKVEFYSSSNPGPLGKPTAMKISSAPSSVRGWDPTDPDKNNPWPEYLAGLEQENQNSNTTNTDQTNQTNTTNTTNNDTVENTVVNDVTNTVDNTTKDETTNVVENDTSTDNDVNEVDENNTG